jgi:lipopolysaccharide transport system permease protein
VVVLIVAAIYRVGISSNIWALPGFVLLGIISTFALGSLLAAINVKYRDVQLVLPMLVQVLFFLSPVVYPGPSITGDWAYVYALNPMASVLDGMRWALFGTSSPGGVETLISFTSALVLLLVSLSYFRRTEQYFADVV